ncbi:hypothetical protein CLAFUW4_04675 [Fulvia fulva]|uniref:RING-type domain-containing protein n=1 Tax=Passalora fulva TaxID=5499 RepID=A0A9Q8LEA9_PASFU|nr:uncharacterized protein CLAFUR5_04636 [Fulvia fulva]KAK4627182.1 hypothetical protein CLAFUR4_04661 [Fulvia fulva]KAK4628632.1 hypothetical protein CLAFUR0_04665 [Fulvia fulva]UJO15905.1 hypothetical protein CLAFUR5_04636 [Fulvia fulva]WPV14419.1 hypothetical protein CLAFUW4_04675 [Fulvia fulva]WPV29113.1 hypothetical protein CLAFUW7_04669 [Fulvia fulva]
MAAGPIDPTEIPERPAGVFEPHHSITLLYPSFTLIKPGERATITMPLGARARYEPHPIVPVESVIANKTSRNETIGTDFTVYLPVSDVGSHDMELSGELYHDMQQVTARVGHTKLRLMLVTKDARMDNLDDATIRISRFTKSVVQGGKARYTKSQYEMSCGDFIQRSTITQRLWDACALELIMQSSDRAVKHQRLRLAIHDITEPENDEWRSPRGIEMDDAIPKIANIMSKAELDQFNGDLADDERIDQCPVCLDDFSDTDSPVKLPCSKKHIVCMSCLREWCKVGGVHKTKCPWCAVQLATPEAIECLRPNYLDMKAVYEVDIRYNRYENHERRCADLDQYHAQDNSTTITINNNRLLETWHHLVELQPKSEPGYSHLNQNPVDSPEYVDVLTAFVTFCDTRRGSSITIQDAFHQSREAIFTALRAKLRISGMYDFMPMERKDSIDRDVYKVPLRPGFKEWIQCSLNRVLQFQTIRQCKTKEECAGMISSHMHGGCGGREYFTSKWCSTEDPVGRYRAKEILRWCVPQPI